MKKIFKYLRKLITAFLVGIGISLGKQTYLEEKKDDKTIGREK